MANDGWTIGKLLEWTTQFFASKGLESPRLDAEILLAHSLGCKRLELYISYDREVPDDERSVFREWVRKRSRGVPVAYLTGQREFYGLPFVVNADVLIPRPETEHLVGAAIDWLKNRTSPRVLDVGVGSGAILLSIIHKLSSTTGVGVDISEKALAVALENAIKLGVHERVQLLHSDLCEKVSGSFDLMVSNPPYISTTEWESLSTEVKDHEPRQALFGGDKGLDIYSRLIPAAAGVLKPGGRLMLEIGYRQESDVSNLIAQESNLTQLRTIHDAAGHPRVIVAERNQ